ncbi:disease resistance protein RPP13-like protein, partial [Tanacetum coccineum]
EKPTTCNAIHDVLRHLIIEKAKDVSYFDIFPLRNYARDERGVVVHMPSIRHAIHGRAAEYIRSLESLRVKPNKKVRTLLFFNTLGGVKARSLADQCALFRDLEVLDLTGIDFSLAWISFSYMLRKIRNLRFLVLANTSINKLPARIKNHRCLQILETGTNSLCILPKGIHRLQQLRHLHGFFHKTLCLPIAHTLHSVRVLSNPLFDIVMETGRMQDLQELSLRCQPQDSLFFIQQLRNLSTLIISSCNSPPGEDPSYVDLPSLEGLSACRNLTNVWLDGPLMPLPASDTYPRSLQRLILSRSALKNDPMPELEMLPNLTSLELMNAYDGKKMVCSKNRFQQLVYLRLSEAGNLREWEVHEGAMPSLQGLTISECPQLIRPQRFEGFPNAGKTKSVYGVPRIIQHIHSNGDTPYILLRRNNEEELYFEGYGFFESSLTSQEASGSIVDLKIIQEENTQPSKNDSEQHDEVRHDDVEPYSEIVPIRRSNKIPQVHDPYDLYVDAEEHKLEDLNEPPRYKAALSDPEFDK